jgi:hypothetical protein
MNHMVIHGSTERCWKPIVSFESRHSAVIADEGFSNPIQILSGNTGADQLGHFGQGSTDK